MHRTLRRLHHVAMTALMTLTVTVRKPNGTPIWPIATEDGTGLRTAPTVGILEVVIPVYSILPFQIVGIQIINRIRVDRVAGPIQCVHSHVFKPCNNADNVLRDA